MIERIKTLLAQGNRVYWSYGLISVAEITNVTEKGNVVFNDAHDNRKRISVKAFLAYNDRCNPNDVLSYDAPDGTEYRFDGTTRYAIVKRYYQSYTNNGHGFVATGEPEVRLEKILRACMRPGDVEVTK